MPVKTVTIQVTALTDAANRNIAATGKYFDALRARNPVELTVKLNSAQALAEARIGLGITAAAGTKPVKAAFASLTATAKMLFAQLGKPFTDALVTILKVTQAVLPPIMAAVGTALKSIAGPLLTIGTELAGSLASPAVRRSIGAIGVACGQMLTALTPQIPCVSTALA